MSRYTDISVDARDDGVQVIRLQRPEVRNALSQAVADDLER